MSCQTLLYLHGFSLVCPVDSNGRRRHGPLPRLVPVVSAHVSLRFPVAPLLLPPLSAQKVYIHCLALQQQHFHGYEVKGIRTTNRSGEGMGRTDQGGIGGGPQATCSSTAQNSDMHPRGKRHNHGRPQFHSRA